MVRNRVQATVACEAGCGTGGDEDLMQRVEIAMEQLGVRELRLSETPGHMLAVRWIIWVRPSAANQDLQAAGRLLGQMDYFRLSEDVREE